MKYCLYQFAYSDIYWYNYFIIYKEEEKHMNDAIKLIGIVIVVIGFVMKFDTLATVVVAGLVTGLISGMSIMDILNTLGTAFLTNRTATLFILTLPVVRSM